MRATHWLLLLRLTVCLCAMGLEAFATVPLKTIGGSLMQPAQQTKSPLMQDQITELIRLMPDVALAGEINERGINFPITQETIDYLKRLSAGAETIKALYSFISNRPPTLTSSLERSEIQRGDTLTIYAKANDPDGDNVQYFWTSSAGNLSGKGSVARLDSSEIDTSGGAVKVTISLTAIDRRGGSDSFSRSVMVKPKVTASADRERHPIIPRARIEEAWMEDKYAIIRLDGGSIASSSWGFIEISALAIKGQASIDSVSGTLPGIPCRVDLLPRENVAEMSFKEPPGTRNEWRKVVIRVRPKDAKRIIRFAVYWQTLEQRSIR